MKFYLLLALIPAVLSSGKCTQKIFLTQLIVSFQAITVPPPTKAFKLLYSDGYVLTQSSNAIVSYERNEFGLKFYLSSPTAAERNQRVLVGTTRWEDMRNSKMSFAIESIAKNPHQEPTTAPHFCHISSSVRHLIQTCHGLANVRDLDEDERHQMEVFKKASLGKPKVFF